MSPWLRFGIVYIESGLPSRSRRLRLERDYLLQVIPGWWRDDAASRASRLLIRSGDAKQTQSHRTTGSANNELCRVERSCRGPAGAPAWRQGDHDPNARMDAALPPGPLSEGGGRAGGCVRLQHPPSFRADARKELVTPWAAHRIGDADSWIGCQLRPSPGDSHGRVHIRAAVKCTRGSATCAD
jgi:hypothetical protein